MAADCNGGRVFVNVVVVLGTEPVLAARSLCCSWTSAYVASDGLAMFTVSWVDAELCPHSVEKTPNATDCLVVVAGVNAGGSAFESAAPAAWFGRGAAGCGCGCASPGLAANLIFAKDSDIVGLLYWSCCTSMHGRDAAHFEV
jgi:hypothetical protein